MPFQKKQGGSKSSDKDKKSTGNRARYERYERASTREKNKRKTLEKHLNNPRHENDQVAVAALRRITTGK